MRPGFHFDLPLGWLRIWWNEARKTQTSCRGRGFRSLSAGGGVGAGGQGAHPEAHRGRPRLPPPELRLVAGSPGCPLEQRINASVHEEVGGLAMKLVEQHNYATVMLAIEGCKQFR